GEVWDERFPSLNLPSATALSSSWDPDIAARYGAVAAVEARGKGVHVILGPTINLHRSPLGGRHFEAFSEDPVLTAEMAAAYVTGVQRLGVAATPKHYVANDFETERFTADVRVSERALREVYLLAFEKAVREAGAWVVMSAYNSVNGATASENPLLTEPLTGEWGFDGVVVSDWTAVRSVESARHPQDLAMPGPTGAWGPALVEAVQRDEVEEAAIDRKVRRLLRLAERVSALGDPAPVDTSGVEDGVAFARLASSEGTVLVRNDGVLPLDRSALRRVAVLGENARRARTQGGGSATVIPGPVTSPYDGLVEALPDVEVAYALGATAQEGFAGFDLEDMTNPVTGLPGAQVRYLAADGRELHSEERWSSTIYNFGGERAIPGTVVVELSTRWRAPHDGTARIGFAYPGSGRIYVSGEPVLEGTVKDTGADAIGAFFDPDYRVVDVPVVAGEPVDLRCEYVAGEPLDGVQDSFAVTFGRELPVADGDALIAEAVALARSCDVAVVVVGTNNRVECEGYDRSDLRLPGRQDDLVAAVAAANPRTVVVVNSGAPVEMPWRDDVAAILLTWFGGQEFGHALADVLLGDVEPGGRLPTTWPTTLADTPVTDVTPIDGVVSYDEGIHIGYRAWLKAGRVPAYPFGFGLGYTTWSLGDPLVTAGEDGSAVVRCAVTNTGDRPGKLVLQVYAARPGSSVDRPVRWLVGFAPVRIAAGGVEDVKVHLPARAFAHWDDGWQVEPGEYLLHVGTSVDDLLAPVAQVFA
ncbi:MAG: glycoside hydrolase family 3 C-terminal domain-containing protein, partial [Nocardioides sp.]